MCLVVQMHHREVCRQLPLFQQKKKNKILVGYLQSYCGRLQNDCLLLFIVITSKKTNDNIKTANHIEKETSRLPAPPQFKVLHVRSEIGDIDGNHQELRRQYQNHEHLPELPRVAERMYDVGIIQNVPPLLHGHHPLAPQPIVSDLVDFRDHAHAHEVASQASDDATSGIVLRHYVQVVGELAVVFVLQELKRAC